MSDSAESQPAPVEAPAEPVSERPAESVPDRPVESEITNASIVEAVLFSADGPLPAAKIAQVLGSGTAGDVRKHIAALNEGYGQRGAAFRVEEVAGGFQMLTLPVYHRWVARLSSTRSESRLSQAALETLAVVAYKQPVIRADIEAIRGVAVGEVLNRLREMNLVKVVGRAEEVGRPMLYGTTRKFLEVFGLPSLSELPKVEALTPPDPDRPVRKRGAAAAADEAHEGAVSEDAGGSDEPDGPDGAEAEPVDADTSDVSNAV